MVGMLVAVQVVLIWVLGSLKVKAMFEGWKLNLEIWIGLRLAGLGAGAGAERARGRRERRREVVCSILVKLGCLK